MHAVFDQRRYLIPFRATLLPQIFTDVLVIGAGVAGMRAALAAAEHGDVIIALKGEIKDSNTYWAQGGIATVLADDDSLDSHIQDTLTAGAGLCDEPIVRQVVEAAPSMMRELIDWGMRLDRDAGNALDLGREGGHSRNRIVHAHGDATGRELSVTLERQCRRHDRVRMFSDCFVLDLITLDGASPRCLGAITHHPKYGLQVIWAKATILASGGCGQVYRESTNPPLATGDGLAIAYRAGAELADMAFMQFHPTTLYVAGASRSLISEAVRGEGAFLVDRNGYRFMQDHHEQWELAPRDVVARAILTQMARTNYSHVFLDCRQMGSERFAQRFPGIFELLRKFDIDPGRDLIPIHPSAHYMIGGVLTDRFGRTNITGLYACGEAACTGLHGANRLASNSLLEGLVFGRLAGQVCCELLDGQPPGPAKIISDVRESGRAELDLSDVRSSLRSVMWREVGIQRDGRHLEEVAEMFDFWASYTLDKIFDERRGWEVQNLLLVGALMTRAASWRAESRGTHFRMDVQQPQDQFRGHDVWVRGQAQPRITPVRSPAESTAPTR
ncbi:MAG: L-aspartate oxidase [Phycisphaeraceae bacterium]|nr:L-aspartate oxidase [Phycisphaeraceae bacterium]